MADNNYINHQIARKDAKNCFVESLDDSFGIGKIHFAFSTYDTSKPTGQRQTNNVHIYINSDEFLELCRKLEFGELKYVRTKKEKPTILHHFMKQWAVLRQKSLPNETNPVLMVKAYQELQNYVFQIWDFSSRLKVGRAKQTQRGLLFQNSETILKIGYLYRLHLKASANCFL